VSAVDHAAARLALIGAGRMGSVHAQAIQRHLPQAELVAIAEPRADAVDALGEAAGAAAVYATAPEALAHPGLDAVIVVTPTDTHDAVVSAALAGDLHVFCEKPLTLDLEASVRLQALAQERGRILQVGFWRRFHPPIAMARQLLADGAIGRPLFSKLTQWDVDCPPVEWCAPDRSGGIFVDMAVHEFDQIEWFLGDRIVSVDAKPLPLVIEELESVGDYDNAVVWFELAGGGTGMIDLSRNGRYGDDIRIEVLGSDGALFIETIPTGRLRLGKRGGIETVWEDPEPDSFTAGIGRELGAFTLALQARDASGVPGAAASIRASELGRAAARSAASGKPERTS
jgi:predicted dehydrogenase